MKELFNFIFENNLHVMISPKEPTSNQVRIEIRRNTFGGPRLDVKKRLHFEVDINALQNPVACEVMLAEIKIKLQEL
jgi:hypothetical protein